MKKNTNSFTNVLHFAFLHPHIIPITIAEPHLFRSDPIRITYAKADNDKKIREIYCESKGYEAICNFYTFMAFCVFVGIFTKMFYKCFTWAPQNVEHL